jgi:hypothetical protein
VKNRPVTITITNIRVGSTTVVAYPDDAHDDLGKRNKVALYRVPLYRIIVSGTNAQGGVASQTFSAIRYGVQLETARGVKKPRVVGWSNSQKYTGNWQKMFHFGEMAWHVSGNGFIHRGPDDVANSDFGALGCIEICGNGQWNSFNDLILRLSGASSLGDVNPTIVYGSASQPPLIISRPAKK